MSKIDRANWEVQKAEMILQDLLEEKQYVETLRLIEENERLQMAEIDLRYEKRRCLLFEQNERIKRAEYSNKFYSMKFNIQEMIDKKERESFEVIMKERYRLDQYMNLNRLQRESYEIVDDE
jgi:hypothetical protein